jgi:ABC-type uncharacterized transport system permease subunit
MTQPNSSLLQRWSPLARWRQQSVLVRELLLLAIAVLAGLLLMPLIIWLFGRASLGSYANGGPAALLTDFFRGLAHGELPFWVVVIGPYIFMSMARAAALLWRKSAVM